MAEKDQALAFLMGLEETLNRKLPIPADMASWIRSTRAVAKTDDKQKHLRLPEAAFLNGRALPVLFNVLMTQFRLTTQQAQQALLNEYWKTTPDIARHSPIHWTR